jgi:hypothetical protein
VPDAFSGRFSEAQRLSVSEVPPKLSQFATDTCDLMFHEGYSRDPPFGRSVCGLPFVSLHFDPRRARARSVRRIPQLACRLHGGIGRGGRDKRAGVQFPHPATIGTKPGRYLARAGRAVVEVGDLRAPQRPGHRGIVEFIEEPRTIARGLEALSLRLGGCISLPEISTGGTRTRWTDDERRCTTRAASLDPPLQQRRP